MSDKCAQELGHMIACNEARLRDPFHKHCSTSANSNHPEGGLLTPDGWEQHGCT